MNRIDVWFAFVVELAVIATIFPLIGWGIAALLKRQSAALRSRVWMLALIALLAFPPLSRVLPRLVSSGTPWTHATPAAYTPGSWESEIFVAPTPGVRKSIDTVVPKTLPVSDIVFESRLSTLLLCETGAVVAWSCGSLFLLLMLAVSMRAAKKLLRNASEEHVAEAWRTAAGNIAQKLRVRAPRLAVNESVGVPMVVGVFRPTVLLPTEHVDWTPAERDGVLLHELSHLKRRDPLGLVFSRIVVAIYWFHPLVWWVAKRLRLERETACDDAVLLHGGEPCGYATFLLKIAAGRPTSWTPALCLAMSDANPVEERIDSVLDSTKPRNPVRRLGYWLTLAGLAVIIFTAGLFSPVKSFFPIGLFGQTTYTATAWIQMLSTKPYYVFDDEKYARNLETFINTQFALMRSPIILEKALENPNIAKITEVRRQTNRVAWLSKKLKLQALQKSEFVTVSFSAHEPKDAAEIVNGVVNAYFEYIENQRTEWNSRLINQLTLELNRQQNAARLLQEEIRNGLAKATEKGTKGGGKDSITMTDFGESILRDMRLNEMKLESLKAELKSLKEYMQSPFTIPQEVLETALEKDPTLLAFAQQKAELERRLEELKGVISNVDDPQIVTLAGKVSAVEKKIADYQEKLVETKSIEIQKNMKSQLAQTVWEKENAVRVQEILVENLRSKYKESAARVSIRTVEIADVSFQQEQLKRINAVIDILVDRVVSLQTEMTAPLQIQLKKQASIPTEPDRWW